MSSQAFDILDQMVFVNNFIEENSCGYETIRKLSPAENLKLVLFSGKTRQEVEMKFSAHHLQLLTLNVSSNPANGLTLPDLIDAENKFRVAMLHSPEIPWPLTIEPNTIKEIAPQNQRPKLCFLMTCQATQYSGMGQGIYAFSPIFRKYFDECEAFIQSKWAFSIKTLMMQSEGSEEWIKNPLLVLPYLLSLEYSLAKVWESYGIVPDYVLGTSFGEYAAAVVTGMITIQEAITLVMRRTELMINNVPEEAFGVLEMDMDAVLKLVQEVKNNDSEFRNELVEISAANSPRQTCIVGKREVIDKFKEISESKGLRCLVLAPYHPYHSSLTCPIFQEFRETTKMIQYKPASNGKFISTVHSKIMDVLDEEYFLDHLKLPANFGPAMKVAFGQEDCCHFLEIGPHPIHIQMAKDILSHQDGVVDEKRYRFFTSLERKSYDKVEIFNNLGKFYNNGYNVKLHD